MDREHLGAREALDRAAAHGVKVSLAGAALRLEAPEEPPPAILSELRRNKAAIVDLLHGAARRWSPTDWRDFYEERAAVAEYDGGLPQPAAERLALEQTARRLLDMTSKPGDEEPSNEQILRAAATLVAMGITEPGDKKLLH